MGCVGILCVYLCPTCMFCLLCALYCVVCVSKTTIYMCFVCVIFMCFVSVIFFFLEDTYHYPSTMCFVSVILNPKPW